MKAGDTINPVGKTLLDWMIRRGEEIEYPEIPFDAIPNHSACVFTAEKSLIDAINYFKQSILGRRYLKDHLFGDIKLGCFSPSMT